ncbi:MAG: hypothetical protein L6243_07310 [Candidatus Altiarchaeales archaeon]|nr:hypothetical protein [Candidatus Altiarchaeota archaeon]MCG2783379.1 hypothetical protein [Candidatus Altiarchaeales archaeon]MBU4265741.1 hypothetical protein [Candidatus Altiarchaeota archaeon]MBU4341517.1 hypothetical protein [Candidatus Altiarchaeota archaeon]MBU4406229.1 hypothetical protein [Candidatus Altiarchaeota archaeon]
MTEYISLKTVSRKSKIEILKALGYGADDVFVLKGDEPHLDAYTEEPIRIDNMLILPGRSPPVIIDNNPLSLSSYLEDYGDVL